ncbi:MAG: DUF4974 domain-containing protein [Muribaculaceae bacterium]|nr:DUF4974 domain-containing protein [Muribaculaceae bacterium]
MNSLSDSPKSIEKYDLVLDTIEHPDKYTVESLNEILSDPEAREIYNLLCMADSVIKADKYIDVDAEWKDFSKKYDACRHRSFLWFSGRAATIAAIVCSSLMAVAATIAVTVAVTGHIPESANDNITESKVPPATVGIQPDTVKKITYPVMFEDESLDSIMQSISSSYGVDVIFNNKKSASLRLYYRLDPTLPLDEVISQLNTFNQINIRRNGNIITID